MATYAEIYDLAATNSELKNKVIVACLIAAETIRGELVTVSNHANRLVWAKQTFNDPQGAGEKMLPAVLAANRALTSSQISGASDTGIQTAVDNAVDLFATGS